MIIVNTAHILIFLLRPFRADFTEVFSAPGCTGGYSHLATTWNKKCYTTWLLRIATSSPPYHQGSVSSRTPVRDLRGGYGCAKSQFTMRLYTRIMTTQTANTLNTHISLLRCLFSFLRVSTSLSLNFSINLELSLTSVN
jgi:hypothetical protein